MKKILISGLLMLVATVAFTQNVTSQNIVIVTLDGLRWQEIFGGADSLLTFNDKAHKGYLEKNFWAGSAHARRKKLMPFLWSEFAKDGVLLGNRAYDNNVNTANPHWFSYPGYNEIFTGFPDPDVNSNDKVPNKHENVLEFLNKQPEFKGKIAAFASWDVFSSIFNEKRSGFPVNDGFKDVQGKLTPRQIELNRMQHELPDLFHGSERLDIATFMIGMEYMKVNRPRLIHFGFGDTDEFAHAGRYDYYLDAIKKSDEWIRQLWEYIQSTPFYANKTTLILTTDHGRGEAKDVAWQDHGSNVKGASEIWIAAIGPSIKAAGESRNKIQIQQGQLAATIANLLGREFKTNHSVLPALPLLEK